MLVIDQAIKAWTRNNLMVGQYWDGGPWKGVFELTLSYNKGIAFGMFQGSALLMAPVAAYSTCCRHACKAHAVKDNGDPIDGNNKVCKQMPLRT
jgi:hypothetical protein